MNVKKWIVLTVTLLLIGATGGVISRIKHHQKLGLPGVKTQPLAGTRNLEVILPERVLDYTSEKMPQQDIVLNMLPKDTSFGERRYRAPDGFSAQVNVVLMGNDRTSIHKPQFCLEGAGWKIQPSESGVETVHMEQPEPYDLQVMKLVTTRQISFNGEPTVVRGLYVYWFVADNTLSADAVGFKRMGEMAWELISTGVLQRWAYVSYFAVCKPGQEQQTFDRLKTLMQASVPEFQLVPAAKKQQVAVAP
jgi:hypothetical protein